jgi:hypothetical protein
VQISESSVIADPTDNRQNAPLFALRPVTLFALFAFLALLPLRAAGIVALPKAISEF